MIDNVKKGNWFDRLKEFILGPKNWPFFKNSSKQDKSMDKKDFMEEDRTNNWPSKNVSLEEKYSTRDKTPLSVNTLAVIELFKNGTKISETPQNGGNLKNEGQLLDKLTRYQVFINFLIAHTNGDKIPSIQYIVENCVYKNEKIFTDKIIKKHKTEGAEIGDLFRDEENKRYYLKRTEKY